MQRRFEGKLRAVAAAVAILLVASACSGDDDDGEASDVDEPTTTTEAAVTTIAPDRPDGPAADISEEITGANPPFIGAANAEDLEGTGYIEEEFVAAGEATSYTEGERTADGRWTFTPDTSAPYRTRALVRRPADADDFSGTVVIEWLNVSGGVDANPGWVMLREELLRAGHAWVGLTTQMLAVTGGPVLVGTGSVGEGIAGEGLRKIDPERYGTLEHPGDGYAYDIYTQVARALREGAGLGELEPQRVLAAGQSQSAFALVTYVNGVQPLTHAFDGFFVHSRGASGLALAAPGEAADIAGAVGGTPAIFRTDTDVPIMDIQSESDVAGLLSALRAHQPDSDGFRLWEVAGTAHADTRLVGSIGETFECGTINDGPMHVVAKAALRGLDTWVRTGDAPAESPRLELTEGDPPEFVRDEDGIVLGGIRTPPVDVPIDVLSSVPGPNPSIICLLLGSTIPMPDERLAALYASPDEYQQRYEAAADDAIAAGFVLEEDRDALLAYADPSRLSG